MKVDTKLALFIFMSLLIVLPAGCEKEKPTSLSCLSGSSLLNSTDKKDKASLPLTPTSPVDQEEATSHFSFVAIGDNGCDCPAEEKIADRMLDLYNKHPYNLVLMLGDNIYGNSSNKGGDPKLFPERFDKYYKVLEDKDVKSHAALGNHDMQTNNGVYEIKDGTRFGIMGEKGYYTYTPNIKTDEKPLVAFFALNSNRMVEGKKDDEQVAWLNRALSESDAIWKIAFFHHPLYSPYGGHKPDIGFRNAIEDILIRENVQVTLAGHNHYYARMKPQKGIIHFISGGGGAKLREPEPNDYTACDADSNNFLYLEVYPEEIRFWAISPEGSTIDSGTIKKETLFHSKS